jgi:hypothetical protein
MAVTAPDFERALWKAVSQIVQLYDDEPVDREWEAGIRVTGRRHRAGVALAVWYKARWPLHRNDEFHLAGYYMQQDSSAAEEFSAVLQRLNYDGENRATNFDEIRDQLEDPALLGPYFYLHRIVPLLNEKGETRQVSEILEALSVWLNQNQIVWFADDSENPGFVALYSTDTDAQLKSAERVMSLHWHTLVGALRLFLPPEFCEYIRRNGEGRHHFMAVVVPHQLLADDF